MARKQKKVYRVVDNEFNKRHYKDIIGKTFPLDHPPSYAILEIIPFPPPPPPSPAEIFGIGQHRKSKR